MKFCRRLHCLLQDTLPEYRDKFLSYKKLKKSLKLIPPSACAEADSSIACLNHSNPQSIAFCRRLVTEEAAFIQLLDAELEKVNSFFLDKEEEFVIRSQEMKARLETLAEDQVYGLGINTNEISEMRMEICRGIVVIHGEMVLLINYSALNYIGFAKILKKHDKMTGRLLRSIYIHKVLQAPFFATDMLSDQVREWEEALQTQFTTLSLPPPPPPPKSRNQEMMVQVDPIDPLASSSACSSSPLSSSSSAPSSLIPLELSMSMDAVVAPMREDDAAMDSTCKNIMAACRIMREFRRGSSTYNFFSFPPFGYLSPDHFDLPDQGLNPCLVR